jgi:hypothetical protein
MKSKARCVAAVLLMVSSLTVPASWAAAIPSKAEDQGTRSADLAQLKDVLARAEVARALAQRGLDADDVERRLARLTDEDLRSLASNVEQIQAAGEVPKYIWILLGIFLAVSILVMVF